MQNTPLASVIVRAKDKADTIERTLVQLRRQTVAVEIVMVDSGSTDGTLEIARRYCDQLIEIRPEQFSYGRALNIGAERAAAPIHFALSAHCAPDRQDWVERSLAHYERPDVAATSGYDNLAPGGRAPTVIYQDRAMLQADPYWGFSNHAGSWRANLWERYPFAERLGSSEDREWSWRVLEKGWVIAMDPALGVPTPHRVAEGYRAWYERHRREARDIATFAALAPYTAGDALLEWWDVSERRRRFGVRARISPRRLVAAVAKYQGVRDSARSR